MLRNTHRLLGSEVKILVLEEMGDISKTAGQFLLAEISVVGTFNACLEFLRGCNDSAALWGGEGIAGQETSEG